jgi:hypothetical protein
MILRNTSNTFTASIEDATATPLYNTNTAVTIGGIVKSQMDSRRLAITSTIRIALSEMSSLNTVLDNFTLELFYTPNCKLYDRTTIEEIKVIMVSNPDIKDEIFYGDKVYKITFKFEEVLSG